MLFEDRSTLSQLYLSGGMSPQDWSFGGQDALLNLLKSYEVEFGAFPLLLPNGHAVTDTASTFYKGDKPARNENHSALLSYRRYNQYAANLQALFSSWNFQAAGKDVSGETNTFCTNLFGNVSAYGVYANRYRTGKVYSGVPQPYCSVFLEYDASTGNASIYEANQGTGFALTGSLLEYLDDLKATVNSGAFDYWFINGYHRAMFRDFRYKLNNFGGIDEIKYVRWLLYPYQDANGLVTYEAYETRLRFEVVGDRTIALSPGYNYLYDSLDCSIHVDQWVLSYQTVRTPYVTTPNWTFSAPRAPEGSYAENGFQDWIVHRYIPFLTCRPPWKSRVPEMVGEMPVTRATVAVVGTSPFSLFGSRVMAGLKDLYPLVFLATENALDEYFVTMEANHIEALIELGDLLRVVDVLKGLKALKRGNLPRLLKAWRRRRNVIRTIDQSLDGLLGVLSDAQLSLSLGLIPTAKDAYDVAGKVGDFLERYYGDPLWGNPIDLRGKFSMELPEDFLGPEFPGAYVTARAKVRCNIQPDSYLTGLLPLRSLGLLPSLSSVWDLIPLSFVWDWFTGTSAKLDVIDTTAMLLAMDTSFSVNTIKVTYRFTEDDEDSYAFNITSYDQYGEKAAGYKYFERFILPKFAHMAPTRLPVFGADYRVPFGTSASLAFKKLG